MLPSRQFSLGHESREWIYRNLAGSSNPSLISVEVFGVEGADGNELRMRNESAGQLLRLAPTATLVLPYVAHQKVL